MTDFIASLRRTGCIIAALIVIPAVNATSLRVPAEYPTIQAAMDVVADGDTILVESGTYAEALTAPPLVFTLLGDTENGQRPIVNPSALPDPGSLACLILPQSCSILIEDFAFVNGPTMYPRQHWNSYGGIVNGTEGQVELRRCVFDSVYWGLPTISAAIESHVILRECEFHNMTGVCAEGNAAFTAMDCEVSGNNWAGFSGRDNTLISNCAFHGSSAGWVYARGANITVEECSFGPSLCSEPAIWIRSWGEVCIENNTFVDMGLSTAFVQMLYVAGSPVIFRSNLAEENYVYLYQSAPIWIQRDWDSNPPDTSFAAIIEENVFVNCSLGAASESWPKILQTDAYCEIRRNRFYNNQPLIAPVVCLWRGGQAVHDNVFIGNDFGVRSDCTMVDATFNFWGHATGPYHQVLNPSGLGDRVSDSVMFDPWYPDTSFLSVPDLHRPLPEQFLLEAFPNPFNSAVTLSLIPPEVMIVRVELFDILGRRVKEIWSGALAFEQQITFDGSAYASGIYFVRVWQPIGNRSLALTKLVLLK